MPTIPPQPHIEPESYGLSPNLLFEAFCQASFFNRIAICKLLGLQSENETPGIVIDSALGTIVNLIEVADRAKKVTGLP